MTRRPVRVLPDSSCLVAAVCEWHERHQSTAAELNRRLARGERLLLAGPAVVESYAVLTRLPPPHRLSARDARDVLEGSFLHQGTLVTLDADDYRAQLRDWPDRDVVGGQAYDAVILACAVKGRADVLLTLNARHFLTLGEHGVEIVVPD